MQVLAMQDAPKTPQQENDESMVRDYIRSAIKGDVVRASQLLSDLVQNTPYNGEYGSAGVKKFMEDVNHNVEAGGKLFVSGDQPNVEYNKNTLDPSFLSFDGVMKHPLTKEHQKLSEWATTMPGSPERAAVEEKQRREELGESPKEDTKESILTRMKNAVKKIFRPEQETAEKQDKSEPAAQKADTPAEKPYTVTSDEVSDKTLMSGIMNNWVGAKKEHFERLVQNDELMNSLSYSDKSKFFDLHSHFDPKEMSPKAVMSAIKHDLIIDKPGHAKQLLKNNEFADSLKKEDKDMLVNSLSKQDKAAYLETQAVKPQLKEAGARNMSDTSGSKAPSQSPKQPSSGSKSVEL